VAQLASKGKKKAVVVGGGLAGLAAAHALTGAGWTVLVLEAAAETGGRCRTVTRGDFTFDTGAQHFRDSYDSTLKTAIDLGLGAYLRLPHEEKGFYHAGEVDRFYSRSENPQTLFPWRSLGARGIMDFARLVGPLARRYRSYNIRFPLWWTHGDGESALDYLYAKGLGRSFLGSFAEPVCRYATGAGLDEVSAAGFLVALRSTFADRTGSFTRGMGCLPTALAKDTEVVTSMKVENIALDRGRVSAVKARPAEGGRVRSYRADLVVCAVPAPEVTALVPSLRGAARAAVEGTEYSPEIVVNLGFDRECGGPAGPVLLPSAEGFSACWVCSNASKAVEYAERGGSVVTAVFSGGRSRELIDREDEELSRIALEDAGRAIDLPGKPPSESRVDRHPLGRPVVSPGHAARVRDLSDEGSGIGGLVLAGDWTHSPTVEGAVSSGVDAASDT
jgi:oxygen-dependent protoporphyrinogen oxidase